MKTTLILMMLIIGLHSAEYSGSVLVGYNGGPGFEMNGRVGQFAEGFPLELQLAMAYTGLNPGNAADARRIFINNATNGDPKKSGHVWDFRFDFLYRLSWLNIKYAYLHIGPRYSMFTGNFKFIGGNEDFDVTSDQWGLGTGLNTYFPMGKKFYLNLTGGFDYYFKGDLTGHDTIYRSDGEHVNPREDYGYGDADSAINQPKFQFRLMIGVAYIFK
jgi:hypothetical protein